ncbi:MAG: hypothetical protein ABJ239_02690 [Erythrobacter sp.]
MTRTISLALISCAAVAAANAVPAMAQDPVRDFTLPPSETPTPTPTPVQGPVDDTGPVPVGPIPVRPIPVGPRSNETDAPTTAPSPAVTPSATPSGAATGQPVAPPQQAAPQTAQPTNVQPTLSPDPLTVSGETVDDPQPIEATSSEVAIPTQSPAPLPGFTFDNTDAAQDEQDDQDWPIWLWLVAGLVGLIVLVGGAWMAIRRRASNTTVPTIVPPIVPTKTPIDSGASTEPNLAATKGRFALDLQILTVMRSLRMVTVTGRVTIANRSDRALRDVAISGDLISASKSVPMEQQMARDGVQLAGLTQIERIGPNKSHAIDVTLQIPIGEIDGFRQGNVPMFVPLARICADCDSADRVAKTYVLGVSSPGQKLHPLPLNGPPGGYQNVGARALP